MRLEWRRLKTLSPRRAEAAGIEGTGPSVPPCLKDLCNTWGQDHKAEGLGAGEVSSANVPGLVRVSQNQKGALTFDS